MPLNQVTRNDTSKHRSFCCAIESLAVQVLASDIIITSIRDSASTQSQKAEKQAQGVVVDFVVLVSGDSSASELAARFDDNSEQVQLVESINNKFESEGLDVQVVGVGAVTVTVIIAASPVPVADASSS